jgi:hypothetical protein
MVRSHTRPALLLACVVFTGLMHVFAQPTGVPGKPLLGWQGTTLTQGPLTVMVPPGWTQQANNGPVMLYSPGSTPQQYLRVEFLPSEQTTQGVAERHSAIMGNLSSIVRPGSVPQNGVTGKFIWTRLELQLPTGQAETMIWYSAKAGSTYVAVGLESTRPELLARNLGAVEAMLSRATLSGASSAGPGSSNMTAPAGNVSAAPAAVGIGTLDEYVFTAPAGWAAQRLSDAIMISSPLSSTNEKCLIYLLPMRPAGNNLLEDANNAFRDAWRGFVPLNRTPAGFAFPETVVHGYSGQGWEYVIIRRGIAPPNSAESRLGFVMVAKLNNRLAVISGVSKDPLVSACMGENTGTTNWPKFFYSLSFRNWQAGDQTQAMRKLLAGEWIAATASAGDKITFAGNGRFANAAAAQQYHLTTNELITTTQAYFGNGTYTLRGNAITLAQDDKRTERGFFRVEQESKDEGRTWADVLYLMRTSVVDGQEYELKFGKMR